jgi:hypothetical protein|tara:strand:- start:133 stop:573 length:441 start_codon:yes stop_codon:yes gene_type:complete
MENDIPISESPNDKFIDEITMKLLSNQTSYSKYLHKTDDSRYKEEQQFIEDCKTFKQDIQEVTTELCKCKQHNYGSDVNEAFNNYSRTLIRYLEVKKRSDEIQKEYDQDDSYGDDLFPFQAESEESDDKPPSYSTGTMDKYLMRKK